MAAWSDALRMWQWHAVMLRCVPVPMPCVHGGVWKGRKKMDGGRREEMYTSHHDNFPISVVDIFFLSTATHVWISRIYMAILCKNNTLPKQAHLRFKDLLISLVSRSSLLRPSWSHDFKFCVWRSILARAHRSLPLKYNTDRNNRCYWGGRLS